MGKLELSYSGRLEEESGWKKQGKRRKAVALKLFKETEGSGSKQIHGVRA